ncbi:hypothetical protein [Mycolicibacter sinensis]|uniref:Uncharacterized protein n=1 Tax=Mycolicibacter sinensis (strain JDM601) TaxID=875328 RepID=A0A1A2XGR7_MYCSD|nr:hypothetical protein [Mycolicibacter sinensis]OBI24292.1 hypothetical protein A5710_00835 [Mycolicibacter sinensis]
MDLVDNDAEHREVPVVASAVSAKRTLGAEVNAEGFVVAVRFFKDTVRQWDSYTLGRRAVEVADVAHDRYLANLGDSGGAARPTKESVAAAERNLNF